MKTVLEQKTTTIDGKKIAYVETTLYSGDDKYSYRVLFDKKTKKRFNAFLTSQGFKVGEISADSEVESKKQKYKGVKNGRAYNSNV